MGISFSAMAQNKVPRVYKKGDYVTKNVTSTDGKLELNGAKVLNIKQHDLLMAFEVRPGAATEFRLAMIQLLNEDGSIKQQYLNEELDCFGPHLRLPKLIVKSVS